jgi:NAD(P)H-dependent FMN reductase/ketosteroid isomerase-like protein
MADKSAIRVGVLVGSLRKQSYSRQIALSLIARATEGFACQVVELGDLPLYNEDLDAKPPRQWSRFRKQIAHCDALLVVTPEYNRSIPGALKNAMDIGSRPEGSNVFDGLPAAIVSVTPYALGAFGANHALRQSFVYLNLRVMQQPEAYIGMASELLGADGNIRDRKADKLLSAFMAAFGEWIDMVHAPARETFAAFMKQREDASNAYIEGDAAPLLAIATSHDPATFFPPKGPIVTGAGSVAKSDKAGARSFAPGSTGRFEVLASGVSGRLAYWSGIQHSEVRLRGKDKPVAMQLRTTEVFRYEKGGWKLVHRHADFMEAKP